MSYMGKAARRIKPLHTFREAGTPPFAVQLRVGIAARKTDRTGKKTFMPLDTSIDRRAFLAHAALSSGFVATSLALPAGVLAHDVGSSFPRLTALVDRYLSERKVANLLVTLGNGQEDHMHTVGGGKLAFRSDSEADENSIYRIYSMTKPVTGIATMMLIEDGAFGLDTPLADILPAFADMRVLTRANGPLNETVAAERAITIRHLLTHTAGLSYIIEAKGPLRRAFVERGLTGGRVTRLPIPGLSGGPDAPSLEVMADRLAQLPLIAQPGTKWAYSASFDLLGRVIEVASGMPFDRFLETRIFAPLGMTSTGFTVARADRQRLTDNYGVLNGTPIPIDPAGASIFLDEPSFPAGGGGLVSTPKDYDRFMRMLLGYGTLDGTQVMEEATVRTAVSNLLPEGATTAGTWVAGQGFGAGGRVTNASFGWGGAAGTLASVEFGLNKRVGLYTQYMPPETYPLREEFIAALMADLGVMREAA